MVIEEEIETNANRIEQPKGKVNKIKVIINILGLESVLTATVLAFSSEWVTMSTCFRKVC